MQLLDSYLTMSMRSYNMEKGSNVHFFLASDGAEYFELQQAIILANLKVVNVFIVCFYAC